MTLSKPSKPFFDLLEGAALLKKEKKIKNLSNKF